MSDLTKAVIEKSIAIRVLMALMHIPVLPELPVCRLE